MRITSARRISMARATPASPDGPEPVRVRAPDKDGAGSQAQRLDDIAAAADPAVHQDLDLTVDARPRLPGAHASWERRRRAAGRRGSKR